MKIALFYQNNRVFDNLKNSLKGEVMAFPLKEISKLYEISVDFLIVETDRQNIEELIDTLEIMAGIPFVILSDAGSDEFKGLHLLEIMNKDDKDLFKKINNYIERLREDGYSIFDITDVMQMISMEKKTIAIRVISENRIGAIAFENGIPIYAKAIVKKEVEYGIEAAFKVISWDNLKFKLIKIIGEIPKNLEVTLTNLLMGAMQYKDELEFTTTNEENGRDNSECQSVVQAAEKITGYVGIYILNDKNELCFSIKNGYDLKNNQLQKQVTTLTQLVKVMLNDIGVHGFENLLLGTEEFSIILQYHEETKLTLVLFLEKDANIPLAKVILKKIMLSFL